jgi:hypothetical protein
MARGQISEKQMQEVTNNTKKALDDMPKRRIRLHLEAEELRKLEAAKANGKEVAWPSEFVGINGHNYQIQRGVHVEVPELVAEVLEQAGLI